MRRIGSAALALVLAGAVVRPAAAQILSGVPLGVAPSGTGIVLGLDYGSPEGGDAAYGVTGGIGFSRFGVAASVGSVDFGNLGDATNYGAMAGMRLFGGGLNPLAIGVQGGVLSTDMSAGSVTAYNVGANVRFSPPLFPLKPWGVVYYALNDNVDDEVRISAGLDFNLVLGLGVHAAYDWGDSGSTWGIGAHFKFGVPGM
jgi:hypothetical protein